MYETYYSTEEISFADNENKAAVVRFIVDYRTLRTATNRIDTISYRLQPHVAL